MGKRKISEFEKTCVAINHRLSYAIGKQRRMRIYKKVFKPSPIYREYYHRHIHYCSECGGEFEWRGQKECPHCHAKFKDVPQEQPKGRAAWYYMELEAKGDIQLTRIYRVERNVQFGKPADIYVWEVERIMYAPNGERKVFARAINGLSYYYDAFSRWSEISIRRESNLSDSASIRYNLFIGSYHVKSLTKQWQYKNIPELLKQWDGGTSVLRVIAYPYGETMLKSGQERLFNYLVRNFELLPKKTERALNICIRNHYTIDDPNLWLENLRLLKHFRMDFHNPHYVCPKDLAGLNRELCKRKRKENERRWEKIQEAIRKKRLEQDKERLEQYKKEQELIATWHEHMGKILTLNLTSNNLTIRPLQNVDEFKEEGERMHHCVYRMKYWNYKTHPSSLILSAKDDKGHRLATVEYNKSTGEIVQCRAACNAVPERDAEIRELINSNKATFEKLLKAA